MEIHEGFFPWANMQNIDSTLEKNSQVQKQVLKGGIFSGLDKGRTGTGVETRNFNSSFDGHSTSSSYVERSHYGPRFYVNSEARGQSNCINCSQYTFTFKLALVWQGFFSAEKRAFQRCWFPCSLIIY